MNKRNAIIFVVFTMMWAFFFLRNEILFFVSCVVLTISLATSATAKIHFEKITSSFGATKTKLKTLLGSNSLRVSTATNSRITGLTKPIFKRKLVMAIQNKLNAELENDIRSAGCAANPSTLAMRGISYMFLSTLVVIPIAVVTAILVDQVFLFILIIPPIVMFYPKIKLKLLSAERRTAIDDEIAFFAMYASVMQTVGKSFYTSILEITGNDIFPMIEAESKMLERNIRLFGMDPITALNSHGATHPNLHFRNMIFGYVSISKSGGDLGQFMERKSAEFFAQTRLKFSTYAKQAEIVGEVMLILLNVLPVLLMMSSFLMLGESTQMITSISFVIVPVITVAMITVISRSQPKTKDIIKFNVFSVALGGLVALITSAMNQPHWLTFALAVSVATIFNYIATANQFREILMVESALPDFFRDITEYQKIGISVHSAIIRIANQRSYNQYFDLLLSEIAANITLGNNLIKTLEPITIRSWLGRASFFILGKIAESGGGTPEILEQITDFSGKIKEVKKETLGALQIFSYMAYASPLLMIWSSTGMKDVMLKIGPSMQEIAQNGMQDIVITPEFFGVVNLLIIISSFCMGMIMSKLTHFTIKHTLTVGIASAIAMIAVFTAPHMPSFVR